MRGFLTVARWAAPVSLALIGIQCSGQAAAPPMASQESTQSFLADDRIEVSVPAEPAKLGQPLLIPIHFTSGTVAAIAADQAGPRNTYLHNERTGTPDGDLSTKVVHEDATSQTIEIIPQQVGEVVVSILVRFADGGIAQREVSLQVVPCATGLKRFTLNKMFRVISLVMDDREVDLQTWLQPTVQYDSLKYPIYLTNAEQLTMSVEQPAGDPVIDVDKFGLIRALRPGKAVITGIFDGVADKVTVTVHSREDAPVR